MLDAIGVVGSWWGKKPKTEAERDKICRNEGNQVVKGLDGPRGEDKNILSKERKRCGIAGGCMKGLVGSKGRREVVSRETPW